MTDREFLEEIKAREELQSRGFRLEKCPYCKGAGFSIAGSVFGDYPTGCPVCNGRGVIWNDGLTASDDSSRDTISR